MYGAAALSGMAMPAAAPARRAGEQRAVATAAGAAAEATLAAAGMRCSGCASKVRVLAGCMSPGAASESLQCRDRGWPQFADACCAPRLQLGLA